MKWKKQDVIDDILTTSKRLSKIAQLLKFSQSELRPSWRDTRASNKQNDDDMLTSFKRLDFGPIIQSIQQTRNLLKEATKTEEVMFHAQVARNLKKLCTSKDGDKADIRDLLLAIEQMPVVTSLDPEKIEALKKAGKATFDEIQKKLEDLRSDLKSASSLPQAIFIAKVVRNAARLHNESQIRWQRRETVSRQM